jgi:DNA-binding response OmpR family regulator
MCGIQRSGAMRILIVEDDRALDSFIKQAPAQEHYAVDAAGDAQQGRDLALAMEYDLIICALGLPTQRERCSQCDSREEAFCCRSGAHRTLTGG